MYRVGHLRRRERVCCEGVEVMICRTDTPVLSGEGAYEGINGFYREVTEAFRTHALETLGAEASRTFEGERGGRFTFLPWEAELRFSLMQADERILSLCLERRQGRRRQGERLSVTYAQTWDVASERLIPLEVLLRDRGLRLPRRKAYQGYYVERDKIVLLRRREDGVLVREIIE